MSRTWTAALASMTLTASLMAHDGPPFPILSDHVAGPYSISIWTDPDTTEDESPGGQFWVRLYVAPNGSPVPQGTRAMVAVKPLERTGPERRAEAVPVRGDITNQFAAVLMDHEGKFAVHVEVDGPLGPAAVDGEVDATYDLRPAPPLLILYLVPFVLVGVLWGSLIMRRRALRARTAVERAR